MAGRHEGRRHSKVAIRTRIWRTVGSPPLWVAYDQAASYVPGVQRTDALDPINLAGLDVVGNDRVLTNGLRVTGRLFVVSRCVDARFDGRWCLVDVSSTFAWLSEERNPISDVIYMPIKTWSLRGSMEG